MRSQQYGGHDVFSANRNICISLHQLRLQIHSNPSAAPRHSKAVDESFVMAKSQHFHVDCFTCAECKESIAGKGYVEHDGKYFCKNCYHEQFSPKCGKCEQIIKGQYVSALDQSYHPDCFNCSECDGAFDGDRFCKREQNPYWEGYYAKLFSVNCKKCEKPIQGELGGKPLQGEHAGP
eukprot:974364_1